MADHRSPNFTPVSLLQPNTSDSSDSDDQTPQSEPNTLVQTPTSSTPPTTTTSTSKKPRGRPPGSKNKPKPPIVITRESDSAMKPIILEISPGSDIIRTVTLFAHKKRVNITLLSGSGSVSNVTLRHPLPHAPILTLHGPFCLLSLWGSYLGFSNNGASSFGVTLSGEQGQVFGGIVGGRVVAASQVVVVAATFANPPLLRLPCEEEEAEEEEKTKPPPALPPHNPPPCENISASEGTVYVSPLNTHVPSHGGGNVVVPWNSTAAAAAASAGTANTSSSSRGQYN